MKHTLLFILLLFFTSLGYGQDSWLNSRSQNEPVALNVQVFPNPTTAHFGITEANGIHKIIVFNLVGRKMKKFQDISTDKRFFVGDLPKGMYLVQMLDQKNGILTTKRINKR
jgi:hypothetical protein